MNFQTGTTMVTLRERGIYFTRSSDCSFRQSLKLALFIESLLAKIIGSVYSDTFLMACVLDVVKKKSRELWKRSILLRIGSELLRVGETRWYVKK